MDVEEEDDTIETMDEDLHQEDEDDGNYAYFGEFELEEDEDDEVEEVEELIPSETTSANVNVCARKQNNVNDDGATKELNRCEIDVCPICFEPWTVAGDHRICCLPCGHIYGMSCIKRWIIRCQGSGKCPRCKSICTLKDVIVLYASCLCCADQGQQLSRLEEQFKERLSREKELTEEQLSRLKEQMSRDKEQQHERMSRVEEQLLRVKERQDEQERQHKRQLEEIKRQLNEKERKDERQLKEQQEMMEKIIETQERMQKQLEELVLKTRTMTTVPTS